MIGKTGTTDSQVQTWMVGSSTNVATAVWVGNIVGDYRLSNYRNGTVLRHDIWRVIMQDANEQYGGESFPAAPDRLLRGSGIELPDIFGLTIDEATMLLESLGLKLEVTVGAEVGRVAIYEPVAGTYLARGMTVRVTSGGAGGEIVGNAIMPNLVGLSVASANATLDAQAMTGARILSCGEGSVKRSRKRNSDQSQPWSGSPSLGLRRSSNSSRLWSRPGRLGCARVGLMASKVGATLAGLGALATGVAALGGLDRADQFSPAQRSDADSGCGE